MNLQHHKQQLLTSKLELEARLANTQRHLHQKQEPVSPNFHEQVVETSNDAQVYQLEDLAQAELQQINRALARIESGEYPYCSRCGKGIGEQRLLAVPYTDHCISCA